MNRTAIADVRRRHPNNVATTAPLDPPYAHLPRRLLTVFGLESSGIRHLRHRAIGTVHGCQSHNPGGLPGISNPTCVAAIRWVVSGRDPHCYCSVSWHLQTTWQQSYKTRNNSRTHTCYWGDETHHSNGDTCHENATLVWWWGATIMRHVIPLVREWLSCLLVDILSTPHRMWNGYQERGVKTTAILVLHDRTIGTIARSLVHCPIPNFQNQEEMLGWRIMKEAMMHFATRLFQLLRSSRTRQWFIWVHCTWTWFRINCNKKDTWKVGLDFWGR